MALFCGLTTLPAQATTLPADSIGLNTPTVDATASGAVTANQTTTAGSNLPGGAAITPKAPVTTPAVSPTKQDDKNTLYGLAFVTVALAIIYFMAKKNQAPNRRSDRTEYYDPEDSPRPRGRMLSSRERRERMDEYRIQPTLDESDLDDFDFKRRTWQEPVPHQLPSNDVDSMLPRYQRQSHATLILPTAKDKRTFADVAGQPEAIARLQEICLWLKQPEIYNRHNAKLPRGILLVGPPGTGKTLCAQALAGETHGSMFSIAASSFVEMYVGVGASRVRALFADAKAQRRQTGKPVIIFIDELDAVGGARGQGINSNSEREQTLNQLLVEMDGFSKNEGIIVVAATNRVDMIDAALRRKGRFDLEVHVDLPDVNGRESILLVHTRDKVLDPTVDFKLLAKRTFGMSGADLAAAANEAAVLAAREQARLEQAEVAATAEKAAADKAAAEKAAADKTAAEPAGSSTRAPETSDGSTANPGQEGPAQKAQQAPTENREEISTAGAEGTSSVNGEEIPAEKVETLPAVPFVSVLGKTTPITTAMFDEAISIVESGDARRERFKAMSLNDKKQTAYHELGHAVVIHKTGGDPITKITILPRGKALGYVQTHTEGDRWNMTEVEMRKRITSAMAGRIAQQIFMDTVDTGAASDFEQANRLARKMVTQFGMSPLGAIYVPDNGQGIGPGMSDKIDDEVNKIVADCAAQARKILEASRKEIESLVELLIARETIFGSDFVAVFAAAEKSQSTEGGLQSQ
jgi:ATP-dependent Zn protease